MSSRISLENMDTGEIDIAIGRAEKLPKRYESTRLIEDGYLCAIAMNHPWKGKTLTMKEYLAFPHLVVVPAIERKTVARKMFSEMDKSPHIAANLSHFLVALHTASETECIVTGPKKLLQKFEKTCGLRLLAAPFTLEPFTISQIWHPFKSNDKGLIWLRQQIEAIVPEL